MYEKVHKQHPDKVADRIAGALVDLAYSKVEDPKIAVEVLIGHGHCYIISETSVKLEYKDVCAIVKRIAGDVTVDYKEVEQDIELAKNQKDEFRCGDNGIFKGVPVTEEQKVLAKISKLIEDKYDSDGKYLIDGNKLIICQSNAKEEDIRELLKDYGYNLIINPLGYWTGGTNVDTGATNRKLGSDMADSVTGGGLHGKDLSKADLAVNICCFLFARITGKEVTASCAIGDKTVNINGIDMRYKSLVEMARNYIESIGGFEKLAEYGLVRYDG